MPPVSKPHKLAKRHLTLDEEWNLSHLALAEGRQVDDYTFEREAGHTYACYDGKRTRLS